MHPSIALQQLRGPNHSNHPTAQKPERLRFNWFLMGSFFGVGVSFLMNATIGGMMPSTEEAAQNVAPSIKPTLQTALIYTPKPKNVDSSLLAVVKEAVDPLINNPLPLLAPALEEHKLVPHPVVQAKPAKPEPTFPRTIAMEVPKGGTLLNMIMSQGISREDAYTMVNALKPVYKPTQMRAGQEMEITINRDTDTKELAIDALTIKLSKIAYVEALKAANGFDVTKKEKELQPETTLAGGTITSSFFQTGYDQGVPNGVLAEMMKALSYDVDFQRDIQTGTKMEVLFDHMVDNTGEKLSYGDIHYAMIDLGRKKPIKIYQFEDRHGHKGFYNPNGQSVVKSLLRTPVNGARISSGFGLRKHPILGYNKLHKGVDFAAPTGTPIYAAGDGIVTFKGRKGGYGNYVSVKHNDTFSTAYAHAHRFAKGLKKGQRVKQGQVIAYVGSTGRSTGPHLHYEVLKHGKQVNPKQLKLPVGRKLAGTDLENFKRQVARTDNKVATMDRAITNVASR